MVYLATAAFLPLEEGGRYFRGVSADSCFLFV